jgi:pimeloyl-ACP methyl ester carboxylesterase
VAQAREVWAREAFAWAELGELMADPVYWAPPRLGDGRLVAVLPGLFANDFYLRPLRSWLDRAGYRSAGSTLWVNAGCPQRLTERVEDSLSRRRRSMRRSGDKPVVLIGHSRGGLLARAIAARLQENASHLVLLGSPVGGITSWAEARGYSRTGAPGQVRRASDQARRFLDPDCDVPDCGCPFPADFLRPLNPTTEVISIYSPDDPIVPAGACHMPGGRNIEVQGTHSGLAFNRAVYRALAETLRAQPRSA